MASKLDYLKKYLAKPGDADEKTDAAKPKDKKKRKKGSAATADSFQIRDLSEALPKPREAAAPEYSGKKAKLLSLQLDEDEKRLVLDDELGYEDPEVAAEASKIDVEKSGVRWKISNHRKQPTKQALRAPLAVKAEVIKEVKDEGSDGDMSPPRQTHRATASSPPRAAAKPVGQDAGSDLSPPRGSAAGAGRKGSPDADLSPPRRAPAAQSARHDSDADLSPPRQAAASKRNDSDADLSPPRAPAQAAARKRHDSDEDLSPPRAAPKQASKKEGAGSDLSPPRRGKAAPEVKQELDDDISPPRQGAGTQRQRHDSDADLSPPRKAGAASSKSKAPARQRHDSDSDLSPPRGGKAATEVKQEVKQEKKRARHDSDADLSPPRKSAAKTDTAPKRQRHDSDSDLSPPRGSAKARHDSDADLSPPRKGDKDDDPEKMTSGLRAGMISGKALKEEAAKVRAERKAALEAAPDHETGKGAETVYRNKAGSKIGREEWVEQQQKKRKKKMSEYPEQELAWGGGLKQQTNKEEEMEETARIASQPFARFEPDAGAIAALQEKQAWNDPMAKYEDNEPAGSSLPPSLSAGAAPKPDVKKPKCPHPPWPNRFGILPGYRWDGAVRGNNYDKRWLQAKTNREFNKTEKYKWERLED